MEVNMRRLSFGFVALGLLLTFAPGYGLAAQQPEQQSPQGQMPMRGGMRGGMMGERVLGTIVSVGGNQIQLKKSDGTTETVQVNDQTRFRERRQPIKLEDLKAGDHVMIFGTTGDNKQFEARMVARVTQEQMERFENGPGGMGTMNAGNRAFGRIESINGNELKVKNPRTGEETIIEVNDQTQFMKQGQSIALSDLKVGDRIFAMGQLSNGKFVADRIMLGGMRGRGGFRRGGMPPPPNPQQ
jgi:Domain of unknown function (DUF5666)